MDPSPVLRLELRSLYVPFLELLLQMRLGPVCTVWLPGETGLGDGDPQSAAWENIVPKQQG